MPYFHINADKNPYKLIGIVARADNKYLLQTKRYEEHRRANPYWGGWLKGRDHYYDFVVPSPKKKLDIKFDNTVYSCKKADPMTVGRLVNHLQTLLDIENI